MVEERSLGCPCLYVEPCHRMCTCVTPVYSYGCDRCCRYGSLEQQTAMAAYLAEVIDTKRGLKSVVKIIVAADPNGVIGINNTIPWKHKADMKRFAAITRGGWLIMGRKTWESMGCRHLPGRVSLVVSRTPQLNVETHAGLDTAIARAEKSGAPIWIIGGGELYRDALARQFVEEVDFTAISEAVEVPEGVTPTTFSMEWLTGFNLVSSTPNVDDPALEHRLYRRV